MEINYLYHTWTLGISSDGLSKAFVYLALPFVKTIFSLSTLQPFCHLYVHTKLVTLTNIYNLNGKWLSSDIFECKLQEMGTEWRTFKRGIQANFLCNMKNNKQTNFCLLVCLVLVSTRTVFGSALILSQRDEKQDKLLLDKLFTKSLELYTNLVSKFSPLLAVRRGRKK